MKKNKWIAIVIIAFGAVGIAYEVWNSNSSNHLGNFATLDTAKVDPNPWKPYISISEGDTGNIYEVVWDQKYGATKTAYCLAIFRNEQAKQYELIASWISGIVIEDQNTNNIKFNKVQKSDVPNYKTCE
jgi:hypothetical protein